MALLLSSAYAPPLQYMAKLYAAGEACIEAHETYVKQSYRNRCSILTSTGVQSLTIPVEHSAEVRLETRSIRISDHGAWRHQHLQALATAYGTSPYFEYYWDDVRGVLERPYSLLWDLNVAMLTELIRLMGLEVSLRETTHFVPPSEEADDWRYRIRPRQPLPDASFACPTYYQPFAERTGFVANLSALDLLFNMGPESPLVLRDSLVR